MGKGNSGEKRKASREHIAVLLHPTEDCHGCFSSPLGSPQGLKNIFTPATVGRRTVPLMLRSHLSPQFALRLALGVRFHSMGAVSGNRDNLKGLAFDACSPHMFQMCRSLVNCSNGNTVSLEES